jgi:hypothetical protein
LGSRKKEADKEKMDSAAVQINSRMHRFLPHNNTRKQLSISFFFFLFCLKFYSQLDTMAKLGPKKGTAKIKVWEPLVLNTFLIVLLGTINDWSREISIRIAKAEIAYFAVSDKCQI